MIDMKKNNSSNKPFVIVKDADVAKKLKAAGFQEVHNNIPNVYTFVNIESSKIFQEIDENKIEYSNLLCM